MSRTIHKVAFTGLLMMGGLLAGQTSASAATTTAAPPPAGQVVALPAGEVTPQIRMSCEYLGYYIGGDGVRHDLYRCTEA